MYSTVVYCPNERTNRRAVIVPLTSESEEVRCTVCGADCTADAAARYKADNVALFDLWLDGGASAMLTQPERLERVVWHDSATIYQRFGTSVDKLTTAERLRYLDQQYGLIASGGAELD